MPLLREAGPGAFFEEEEEAPPTADDMAAAVFAFAHIDDDDDFFGGMVGDSQRGRERERINGDRTRLPGRSNNVKLPSILFSFYPPRGQPGEGQTKNKMHPNPGGEP